MSREKHTLGGHSLHIASSSAHQIMFVHLLLSLPLLSSVLRILPSSFVEAVTMNSLLVIVLILASGINSRGQGARGEGLGRVRGEGVPVGL